MTIKLDNYENYLWSTKWTSLGCVEPRFMQESGVSDTWVKWSEINNTAKVMIQGKL